jgi:hypothetical protein
MDKASTPRVILFRKVVGQNGSSENFVIYLQGNVKKRVKSESNFEDISRRSRKRIQIEFEHKITNYLKRKVFYKKFKDETSSTTLKCIFIRFIKHFNFSWTHAKQNKQKNYQKKNRTKHIRNLIIENFASNSANNFLSDKRKKKN